MYLVFVNWMRTVVPLLVGWILTAAHFLGLDPSSTTTTAAVVVVLTGAYYTAFRLLEHLATRLQLPALRTLAGVLLGWARPDQPVSGGSRTAGKAWGSG